MNDKPLATWLVKLVDPFLTVDPKVRKRLEQIDLEKVQGALWVQALIWPAIYIAHYHFNDQSKQPLTLYFAYRYGTAAAILVLGGVGYLVRNSSMGVRLCLVGIASLMCYVQSWSMTLGPYISHGYLVALPLIVLASFSRSFLLPAFWLLFLSYTSRYFWGSHAEARFVFSDVTIGWVVLLGLHLVRRVWLDSRAMHLSNEDLRRDAFLAQHTFDKQIKSFVSPVLIRNIEDMTARGANFIAALDSVLKLKKANVAVLFSDMRNFSSRSDDLAFIEKELIPSARLIIDAAEQNSGIAKQIGDAVFIYYSLEDPEESLLRSLKDAIRCSLQEKQRIYSLGREQVERFFTIAFGPAFVGNMASAKHREATIIGSPANLVARIDALTKEKCIVDLIAERAGVLLERSACETIKTFSPEWDIDRLDLNEVRLEIRSYPDHREIFFMPANEKNIDLLNRLLAINEIPALKFAGGPNG